MVHNLVIVGAGKGGKSLIPLFYQDNNINIIGIADINPDAPGLEVAQKYGILTTNNYMELIKRDDIHIVVNVTGNDKVRKEIGIHVAPNVEVIEGESANLFWSLVNRREEQKKKYEVLYNSILDLSPDGNNDNKLYENIVKKVSEIVDAQKSELYILDHTGENIKLLSTTDWHLKALLKENKPSTYARGMGLTGWVFKTGKHFFVNNFELFREPHRLSDKELYMMSDGPQINEEDRKIKWIDKDGQHAHNPSICFLGVPIKCKNGEVIGVIRSSFNKKKKISDFDIKELKHLAFVVSMVLSNEKEKLLKDLLIQLGSIYNKKKLFSFVVEEVPKLILGRGCSIFLLDNERKKLELAYTNSSYLKTSCRGNSYQIRTVEKNIFCEDDLIKLLNAKIIKNDEGDPDQVYFDKNIINKNQLIREFEKLNINEKENILNLWIESKNKHVLSYDIDQGKTGLVAKLKRTLVVNYYGNGQNEQIKLESDYDKYHKEEENNLISYLYDRNKKRVGIIRLHRNHRRESEFTNEEKERFKNYLKDNNYIYLNIMGSSRKEDHCETGPEEPAISFLALPIKDKNHMVMGVLRIPRTFAGSIFTNDDLSFIESIIDRLKIVLEKERSFKTHLNILSDINSKINSSIDQNVILDHILEAATNKIGFEFATIQLADEQNNLIWTSKGRKNTSKPEAMNPDWVGKAKHLLNPKHGDRDIHAWILQELKKEIIIKGRDPHFDIEIYNKFHHNELIRVFVPIIAHNVGGKSIKIGTLEAGHNIRRKDFIDDIELGMIKALANQASIAINNSYLHAEMERLSVLDVQAVWDTVAWEVPHRIGTHIDGMAGDLESLLETLKCDSTQAILKNLYSSSKKIMSFLDEFKSYPIKTQQIRRNKIEKVNLLQLIDQCLAHCGIRKGIKIKKEIDSNIHIDMEEIKISSAFIEILSNIVGFVSEIGEIKISAAYEKGKDLLKQNVIINFIDNGVGVHQEMKNKIFDLLVTDRTEETSPPGKISSGVGLAIAKKNILMHGGSIREKGIYGFGANFEIILPLEQ